MLIKLKQHDISHKKGIWENVGGGGRLCLFGGPFILNKHNHLHSAVRKLNISHHINLLHGEAFHTFNANRWWYFQKIMWQASICSTLPVFKGLCEEIMSEVKEQVDKSVIWSKWCRPEVLNAGYCYIETKVHRLNHLARTHSQSCNYSLIWSKYI